MFLRILRILAILYLAANAVFLLYIPYIDTVGDFGDDKAVEGLVINPFKRSVALECPECPFATANGDSLSWKANAGSSYLLDFEIGPHEHTLEIDNGHQLFPPPMFSMSEPTFHVSQIDPTADKPLRLRVTGYTVEYTGADTIEENGTELLPITLQIATIEGVRVQPPALTIHVLKDAKGRLMIANFETAELTKDVASEPVRECNMWPLLCKWKHIKAVGSEKLYQLSRGCHERPHGLHNPMGKEIFEGKPPHRVRPGVSHGRPHTRPDHRVHHHKGHGHHACHGHHKGHGHYVCHGQYGMTGFVRRVFYLFVIPSLVGALLSIPIILIGIVLLTLFCLVFVTLIIVLARISDVLARIRGQDYQQIAMEDDVERAEAEVKSEKAEYAELPAYEAPPVYEDGTEKEVDEFK